MSLKAIFDTSKGTIRVDLLPEKAPVTCANFVTLANRGFHNRPNPIHCVLSQNFNLKSLNSDSVLKTLLNSPNSERSVVRRG